MRRKREARQHRFDSENYTGRSVIFLFKTMQRNEEINMYNRNDKYLTFLVNSAAKGLRGYPVVSVQAASE